jgi:hypothetical protein
MFRIHPRSSTIFAPCVLVVEAGVASWQHCGKAPAVGSRLHGVTEVWTS